MIFYLWDILKKCYLLLARFTLQKGSSVESFSYDCERFSYWLLLHAFHINSICKISISRELFKPSKDAKKLVVSIKKLDNFGFDVFCG